MNASLSFPFDTPPKPAEALTVASGIEWLRMPLPFALNHINLWLVAKDQSGGADGHAAIDTGIASEKTREAWRALLAERQLSRVLVTHYHPDHLGNAAWLERETGARLWMSQADFQTANLILQHQGSFSTDAMLAWFHRHGLNDERFSALQERGNSYRFGVPDVPASFQRLFPAQTLRIGDHDWRTIVGYGHAPEHMSLYCDDLHVLISGDMLLPTITTNVAAMGLNPHGDPLGWFLESIERFRDLPEDTLVLPSHGLPFRGLHARLDQLRAHHANRLDILLRECMAAPRNAAELLPALFDREIPDPHQTMFAMGEAIAHLLHLENDGRLVRIDDEVNMTTRFVVRRD